MKSIPKGSSAAWCAIFIAVVSLVFLTWHVRRMNNAISEMTLIDQGILERLDYFNAREINEKLSSQKSNIFLCKWRDCAMRRGYVTRSSAIPQVYEINDLGSSLVKALDSELFQFLTETKKNNPEDTAASILSAVNLAKLHTSLYEYNRKNSASVKVSTILGILVAHIAPSAEMS